MKKTIVSILAAVVFAGIQAHAITFTETITLGNGIGGHDLVTQGAYNGSFTDASLLSGATAFTTSGYTITSGQILLFLTDAQSSTITLKVNATLVGSQIGNNLTYTLNSTALSYIQSHNPIAFSVSGDCYLDKAELIINATQTTQTSSTPDAASTAAMFGGALTVLGLIKRKLA